LEANKIGVISQPVHLKTEENELPKRIGFNKLNSIDKVKNSILKYYVTPSSRDLNLVYNLISFLSRQKMVVYQGRHPLLSSVVPFVMKLLQVLSRLHNYHSKE
jgi:hypothetical protein